MFEECYLACKHKVEGVSAALATIEIQKSTLEPFFSLIHQMFATEPCSNPFLNVRFSLMEPG